MERVVTILEHVQSCMRVWHTSGIMCSIQNQNKRSSACQIVFGAKQRLNETFCSDRESFAVIRLPFDTTTVAIHTGHTFLCTTHIHRRV